jgi:hypothetical protein
MEIVKKDEKLAESQKEVEQRKIEEEHIREDYLKRLRNDPLFQKYVIQEIFEVNLNEMTDIRNMPAGTYTDLGKLVLQAKAARAKLESILRRIMN